MELKSSELRFEYTFTDRSEQYQRLFLAADSLSDQASKLDNFRAKYQGDFFDEKRQKLVELSESLEDIKRKQKELKVKEATIKVNLAELTKDFETNGCKGIKPVVVKFQQLVENATKLLDESGIDKDEFPALFSAVRRSSGLS